MASASPAAYSRCTAIDIQARAVELFDIDAAVLQACAGLHQSARGFLRISEGSLGGELHAAAGKVPLV